MEQLSVIIATRGRPEWAAATTRAVLGQGHPVQVVVVDQSDDPVPLAERLSQTAVERVTLPPRGLPYARNVGLRRATGEVVLFLDDDVTVLPGLLAAHAVAYRDEALGGAVGRIAEVSVRPNAPGTVNVLDWDGRIRTNLWGAAEGPVASLKGANMSFRRRALIAAGGFDTNYGGTAFLEDTDASERVRRLGWKLAFLPRAEVVHHSAPAGGVRVGAERTTEWWRFRNTGYFLRRHRGARAGAIALATFTGIAARRANEWRDPSAFSYLLGGFREGWRSGQGGACCEPPVSD